MDFAIWVKRHAGNRYFHIDDVVRVFDHYGEAQILIDNDGREEIGWIDVSEVEKVLRYKPELVRLCIVGYVRRLRRQSGLPWSYHSRFDNKPLPEPLYIPTS